MRIVAIIASYNRKERTLRCIEQFFATSRAAGVEPFVVLVDDASTDGTATDVQRAHGGFVDVVHGTGTWFWARAMAEGERRALARNPDYVFWLNDDVELFTDAIPRMLQASIGHIGPIVGSMSGPNSKITYSGYILRHSWRTFRFEQLTELSSGLTPVDTFNGNSVLIPVGLARQLGEIDGAFPHAYADLDYGLRCKSVGATPAVLFPPVGVCARNPGAALHYEARSLRERLRAARSPKGIPIRAQIRFYKRHGGSLWPLRVASSYRRVFFNG